MHRLIRSRQVLIGSAMHNTPTLKFQEGFSEIELFTESPHGSTTAVSSTDSEKYHVKDLHARSFALELRHLRRTLQIRRFHHLISTFEGRFEFFSNPSHHDDL